jgi:dTDP-glucose 4,6-dehydratase
LPERGAGDLPVTRVVVTGGSGFVGAALIRHILRSTDWDVVTVVSFRHGGWSDRLATEVCGVTIADSPRVEVITHDLSAPVSALMADRIGEVDTVFALAAGSHVDASIASPAGFVANNVNVMLSTLEWARHARPRHVVVVSTDEVYGSALKAGDLRPEWAPIVPSSPYSASKAAQEAVSVAWWRAYGVPVSIVNMTNVYGPAQSADKFVPLVTAIVRAGGVLPVHGSSGRRSSRWWVHVDDVAEALLHVGRMEPVSFAAGADRPSRWNVAGATCADNLELAQRIAGLMGRDLEWGWSDARPGADAHYGLDGSALAAAGWSPGVPFDEGLKSTVEWYLRNPRWLLT